MDPEQNPHDKSGSPIPQIPQSATVQLVTEIELMTGSSWTQDQRYEVAELVRKYRFLQVSAVLARVQKLVRESGDTVLSEKIYMGRF